LAAARGKKPSREQHQRRLASHQPPRLPDFFEVACGLPALLVGAVGAFGFGFSLPVETPGAAGRLDEKSGT
jgi:hypothetical protein